MFFKSKKVVPITKDNDLNQDLAIITQMNQEFATSLDLNETLQTALEVIIKRINAQAANIFLIDEKKQVFQCIASKYQSYLDEYEIPLTQGVMGKAVLQKKCIRVGDVRKDVREIAEFYCDLDNNVFCISPTISISFCILFFSTSSFAIFALRIAKAAGADNVSNNFLSFSSNNLEDVFLFKQWITPIHSFAAINGEQRTE